MGFKYPTIKLVEGENPWVTYTKKMVFEKNNCLNSVWTGQPGMGKSWGTLSFCKQIDPDFQLEGNWFFKAGELMKAIKKQDWKPGKIFVLDEAGIDLNNMKYFNEVNKGLNAFLQTGRHRNFIFCFTVPYLSLVSKGVRMLMTAQMKAMGWNRDNQTIVMPRVMEYNGDMDKFYKKRLLIKDNDNPGFCNKIALKKPPKQLLREYESMKKEFTSDLFEDISNKIDAFEMKQKEKFNKSASAITQKQEQVLKLLKKGYNANQLCDELQLSPNTVYGHMKALRKKGIIIQPIRSKKGTVDSFKVVAPNL